MIVDLWRFFWKVVDKAIFAHYGFVRPTADNHPMLIPSPPDMRCSADTLERLRAFDTATIFEAGRASGTVSAMEPGICPSAPGQRIVGPALTVACPAGDNLMLHVAVATSVAGEVLTVQCHDQRYGVWGEVLMVAAASRGVAGLVVDGGVRDLEAIREAKFPVFSRGFALRGTEKKARGLLRHPISCGGILVWPGDIIVADDSGVVAISSGHVDDLLASAEQRQRAEAGLMKELRSGKTTVELLKLEAAISALE